MDRLNKVPQRLIFSTRVYLKTILLVHYFKFSFLKRSYTVSSWWSLYVAIKKINHQAYNFVLSFVILFLLILIKLEKNVS